MGDESKGSEQKGEETKSRTAFMSTTELDKDQTNEETEKASTKLGLMSYGEDVSEGDT